MTIAPGLSVRARLAQRDVDYELDVAPGEIVAVLGPNGAGKSTLLELISGSIRPDDGRIESSGSVLTDTSTGVHLPPHARGIATLSQQPLLFPHMSIAANVAFSPRSRGSSRAAAAAVAATWLDAVDVADLADRRPAQLSGGQAQRVAIARALAADPTVLLLDEPMAALDVTATPDIRRLLKRVLRESHRTALLVTHDVVDALSLADTAIVIESGRIVERGDVSAVLTTPRSAFGARIAGVNLIRGAIISPGTVRTDDGVDIFGTGDIPTGAAAVALFAPSAVAVHTARPSGSPRNVLRVMITDLEARGVSIRVTGTLQDSRLGTPVSADVTAHAVAELDLAPGQSVHFAVKAQEVALHPS